MKKLLIIFTFLAFLVVPPASMASYILGGDALSQAAADDILDIIFLIDVSGSMVDDINAIGAVAENVILNLECPDCDVWVRATFAGINGTYGTVFNEAFTGPNTNSIEDNGAAALDAINAASGTWWLDDSIDQQDYYRAVVTIGDEGTDNGTPVTQSDWDFAYQANQAAIATPNLFLFSWVTNDPYSGVVNLFETMAMGGTGGITTTYTFGFAGGGFVNDQGGTGDVGETLESIICTAGSGGGGNGVAPVPEPSTILLMGVGLLGLVAVGRRKFNHKE